MVYSRWYMGVAGAPFGGVLNIIILVYWSILGRPIYENLHVGVTLDEPHVASMALDITTLYELQSILWIIEPYYSILGPYYRPLVPVKRSFKGLKGI